MRLDRIIYLQQPVVARDNFGSEVTTWTTRAEVWASFENVGKNTERYIRNASTTHVFRMGRYEIRRPTVRNPPPDLPCSKNHWANIGTRAAGNHLAMYM